MKLYAYCLTEDIDVLPETLQGVASAEVRLFKTENFSLLVSEFSGDVVPVNRDNALAHAAVVRSVLDRTTPLPFRFGTLGTEEQLRSYVTARRDALVAKFGEVRGCVEMNVKIISGQDLTPDVDRDEEKPGTSFLLQKRQEILGTEKTNEVALWLDGVVAEYVRGKESQTNVTSQLILSAAHLVKREVVSQYRERLKAARSERPDLKFLISGPWPPYTFANIDL